MNKNRLVFFFFVVTFSRRGEAEAGNKVEEERKKKHRESEREKKESGGGTQRGKWCSKHFRLKSKDSWFNPGFSTQGDHPPQNYKLFRHNGGQVQPEINSRIQWLDPST